jgi:cytochrome P450
MYSRVARASLLDSLRFSLFYVLPMAVQGVFRKRPFWVRVVGALHRDPLGRRFVAHLRSKYSAAYVDLSMLGRQTRLVLDPQGIREVLERSPDAYAADPSSKREGMSIFQPNAVTISRMPEWAARRRFNDLVLKPAVEPPLDAHFVHVVRDEVGRWHARRTGRLVWADLQEVFDHVTLRVVFGDAAREDRALLGALDTLMARANRVLLRRRSAPAFDTLYAGIRRYLEAADPNSLAGLVAGAVRTAGALKDGEPLSYPWISPETQVPHWMFAMKDTLAANTAFTLGLLATHTKIDEAVRAALPADREPTAADLHAAALLEGCIQEGMRLWPTTPMLLREAATGGVLGGVVHGPGLQVLIWNAANHRDAAIVPDPDRFDPGRWADSSVNWQFNHLSNGRQGCAGKALALFLAKAVIAELSRRARFTLLHPQLLPDRALPETFDWFRLEMTASC